MSRTVPTSGAERSPRTIFNEVSRRAEDPPAAAPNALGASLGLLGDEWTLLILRYAFEGRRRFTEWRDQLGIGDAVLSSRLARLTDEGLLVRVRYSERPERFEYRLTDAGLDLWALLLTIWAWELRWAEGQADRLPRMRHRACSSEFAPVLGCAACHRAVGIRDVVGGFGPGGSYAGSIPSGTTRRRNGRSASASTDGPGLFPETMAIVGNRWSSGVLGAAFMGDRRFGEFQQHLGASPNVISDRLRTFVELGVLAKTDGPARPTYRLTDKGEAFFPAVMSLLAWGERWRPSPAGPTLLLSHTGCGSPFHPELICSSCDGILTAAEVLVKPAPGHRSDAHSDARVALDEIA